MKLKYIFKYLLVTFIVLQLAACTQTDVKQKFEETPTERLNKQQKELDDLLLSSEFGWKLVYFTDNTQLGGFTHLIKFSANKKVDMASDFDSDSATYSSEYAIQLGSTASVVFTTKNRIHLLSDSSPNPANVPTPALKGKGYLGDFQFLYYGQENGEIIFKTNRDFKEIRFIKATAQDWMDLPKNSDMIPNVIGATTRPLFRLLETNEGTTKKQYDFSFDPKARFATANSIETGSQYTYNMGIAYTPTGIIVSPAVEVGNQKLTNFVYNNVDGSFTATGTNGVTAIIKYSTKPLVLTDDYKKLLIGQPQIVLGYINANLAAAPSNSLLFNSLITEINAGLLSTQKVNRIQPYFNDANGDSYIVYTFTGGKTTIYHNFTIREDAVNKRIILIPGTWQSNSGAIIPEPALLKKVDLELMNPSGLYIKKEAFKFNASNSIYTITSSTSNFRMTTYQL